MLDQDRFLRLREVASLTGLSRSSVYRLESSNDFPKRIKLSERCSAWKLGEIQNWMASRPRAVGNPQVAA